MKNIFDAADRSAIIDRIRGLGPDNARRWGTMSLSKALCHMGDQLSSALGELEAKRVKTPVSRFPIKQLVVWVMPWPKGIQTAPEMLTTDLAELDVARDRLVELIERMGARGVEAEWTPHVAFGPLSGKAWGRLAWRHLDHHLKQFGG